MQNTLSLTEDTCLYAVGGRARKGSEKGRLWLTPVRACHESQCEHSRHLSRVCEVIEGHFHEEGKGP